MLANTKIARDLGFLKIPDGILIKTSGCAEAAL